MHISEGVLSPAVLAAGWALAAGGAFLGMRKAGYEKLVAAASMGAAFFTASLVHVPLGPGSVHLILNGILGVFLGWTAVPVLMAALLLQAVLFQFGGLAVLGVNAFDMGLPAVLCGLAYRAARRRIPSEQAWARRAAGFAAGSLSVAGAALLTACMLALSGEGFLYLAGIMAAAHLPVMVIEGIVTVFIVEFIERNRPEMLEGMD